MSPILTGWCRLAMLLSMKCFSTNYGFFLRLTDAFRRCFRAAAMTGWERFDATCLGSDEEKTKARPKGVDSLTSCCVSEASVARSGRASGRKTPQALPRLGPFDGLNVESSNPFRSLQFQGSEQGGGIRSPVRNRATLCGVDERSAASSNRACSSAKPFHSATARGAGVNLQGRVFKLRSSTSA